MQSLINIYRLGIKELWGLLRDPIMLLLIAYCFTFDIYIAATATSDSLHHASIAVVDEDDSPLSRQIIAAFYPPMFNDPVKLYSMNDVDHGMDTDNYTFALNIPPNFQRDVLNSQSPELQLNIDATRMGQAFVGNGYITQIVTGEVTEYVNRYSKATNLPVNIQVHTAFNPNLTRSWFGSVMEIINIVTTLSIILTGAALMKEREHGTIDHLLAMPVTPFEIMLSKVWSMGLVVLISTWVALLLVVHSWLKVPIAGSVSLFLIGAALHLFVTTSLGIFMATVAKSTAQFAMLLILVLLPLQMLSGGSTPRESMPEIVQNIMMFAPTTHFVELGQAILYRGAGLRVVWTSFAWLLAIGAVFFLIALRRFRSSIVNMGS
ncbi:MAG: ABC transporter permease [Gilliamella sp.]|uniref:ABC transporter permease n=1 Tax=unclassified Gilliamella TaxID=2685620 RepID=UPI0025EEBB14|nr:ABC transporter permease [Gilliamella sp.]MCO6538397.1 ABC transporter permease [Gilliamella sp.]MCO6545984.1 ABC transporter permease [Gilliamella sp.]MCO6546860.1 ABC transporter permease [Gilliamella sp.]MCO6557709.1 ABC transporter permease [Gilliamella sp.]